MKALIRALIVLVCTLIYYAFYKIFGFEITVLLAIGQLLANDIMNDIEKDYEI